MLVLLLLFCAGTLTSTFWMWLEAQLGMEVEGGEGTHVCPVACAHLDSIQGPAYVLMFTSPFYFHLYCCDM